MMTDIPVQVINFRSISGLFPVYCQITILVSNQCDPNPCINSGHCFSITGSGYYCKCPWMYTGKRCEQLKLSRSGIPPLDNLVSPDVELVDRKSRGSLFDGEVSVW